MMRKLIVANFKMNMPDLKPWRRLRVPRGVHVVICPPLLYMSHVSRVMSHGVKLGAQDCFWEEKGAYTGEVSPKMLKDLGAKYAIIGHSERRKWLHETDEMIAKKVAAALSVGLKVILCVGEPLAVRRKGLAAAKRFVAVQLRKDLAGVSRVKGQVSRVAIAYEPIWAIGTGRSDKPEETVEMAEFIKQFCYSRFASFIPDWNPVSIPNLA